MKLSPGQTLVLATANEGKINELTGLLSPYSLKITTLKELNLKEPDEIGSNFKENAIIKARACAYASGFPALADDSGLAVRALGGQPGIFTANWAGPHRDFMHAMTKVHTELVRLEGHPDRRAQFICCLVLWFPDDTHYVFEGKIEGELAWPIRGNSNLGFDPMFVPLGFKKTFGEMTLQEKQKVSHRRAAFAQFARECLEF